MEQKYTRPQLNRALHQRNAATATANKASKPALQYTRPPARQGNPPALALYIREERCIFAATLRYHKSLERAFHTLQRKTNVKRQSGHPTLVERREKGISERTRRQFMAQVADFERCVALLRGGNPAGATQALLSLRENSEAVNIARAVLARSSAH